jgi:two-component system, NarL family, response regulator NreC
MLRTAQASHQSSLVGGGGAIRVRAVLAVRHDRLRSALGVVLAGSSAVDLVGEADDAVGGIELVRRGPADVLVLDRRLPDCSSPESVRRTRHEAPGTSIVVVAMADNIGFAIEAIGAGASGYVLKDAADAELVDAILAAGRGECYVSRRVAERMRPDADRRELSESQLALLRLVARGHVDGEVGRELGLSDASAEACRADIYRLLGFASRAGFARYALRHGLLDGH